MDLNSFIHPLSFLSYLHNIIYKLWPFCYFNIWWCVLKLCNEIWRSASFKMWRIPRSVLFWIKWPNENDQNWGFVITKCTTVLSNLKLYTLQREQVRSVADFRNYFQDITNRVRMISSDEEQVRMNEQNEILHIMRNMPPLNIRDWH